MSPWDLWWDRQCAGLSTAAPPAPPGREASGAVDNPCAKPEEFKTGLLCLSIPSAHETTLRSAFSDTDHSWQVAAGEGGTCTRRLRICRPKRLTISALGSSPRVRLRSTTNTQGSPSYRLTILPSQNASTHVPGDEFITAGGPT